MNHKFDFSTFAGVLFAFFIIIFAALMDANTHLSSYLDLGSFLIVAGGTLAVTAACFSIGEMLKAIALIGKTIFYRAGDPAKISELMVQLAEDSRKDGLLSLEHFLREPHDPFFDKGLRMIVDGMETEHAEAILKNETLAMADRHQRGAAILRKCSEIAPAMGLIGTLIGLVQMLSNLNDPSKIGSGMAIALLTTLYGAMMAYLVFSPLATKLERNSREEVLLNTLYTKSIASIGKKENPRRLEMLLNSILPPSKRINYFKD